MSEVPLHASHRGAGFRLQTGCEEKELFSNFVNDRCLLNNEHEEARNLQLEKNARLAWPLALAHVRTKTLFCSKIDGFVPRDLRVNLRIVGHGKVQGGS